MFQFRMHDNGYVEVMSGEEGVGNTNNNNNDVCAVNSPSHSSDNAMAKMIDKSLVSNQVRSLKSELNQGIGKSWPQACADGPSSPSQSACVSVEASKLRVF